MNHLAISRVLSILGLWLAGLMLLNGCLAVAFSEFEEAALFAIGGVLIGFLGAMILLLTERPKRKSRAQDGLAVACLFWVLVPLITQIPFWNYVADLGPFYAYYEAMSNLTTTGHSLIDTEVSALPASLLIWRAVLHFMGALATITIAATVLAALNLGGPGIHRTRFFTIPEGSFFDTLPPLIRLCSLAMISAIVVLTGLMLSLGVSPREALSGAVSVITTGLVDPASYRTAPSGGAAHGLILAFGLILGAIGIFVFGVIARQQYRKAITDAETVSLFGAVTFVALLAVLAGLPVQSALGWSLSSVSTSGIALSDPVRFDRIPLILLFFPVLIGGSALSAAGGVKLSRVFILMRRVGLEFSQLGYRGSIQFFNFRGRRLSEQTIMGVWVYLVGYIVATVVGVLILSITGSVLTDAMRITIGAITNSGHVMSSTIETYTSATQVCAILGMILGRLEVISLVPVISLAFWRE